MMCERDADANATVTLTEGSTVLGTTTANASGVWAFTLIWARSGRAYYHRERDQCRGSRLAASSLTFTYDTAALTVTVALADDTGGTNITANDALSGAADVNATVTLTRGSTVLGSTTANGSGVRAVYANWPGSGRANHHRRRDQCRGSDWQLLAHLHR